MADQNDTGSPPLIWERIEHSPAAPVGTPSTPREPSSASEHATSPSGGGSGVAESSPGPRARQLLEQQRREAQLTERENHLQAKEAMFLSPAERQQLSLNEFKAEGLRYLEENRQELELVHAFQAQDKLLQFQQLYFEKTGKVPTHAEAAAALENHCRSLLEAVRGTRAFEQIARPSSRPLERRPVPPSRNASTDQRPLDDAERYRRAIAALDMAAFRRGGR